MASFKKLLANSVSVSVTKGLTVRHSKESKPWDFKAAKANLLWKIDLSIFDTFE